MNISEKVAQLEEVTNAIESMMNKLPYNEEVSFILGLHQLFKKHKLNKGIPYRSFIRFVDEHMYIDCFSVITRKGGSEVNNDPPT